MGSAGTWQGSMTPREVVVVLPWGQRSLTGDYLGGRDTLVLDKVTRSRYQIDGSVCYLQ
jgi:hypothetical protein